MRGCAVVVALLALPGCAERDLRPVEKLDPKSAVHVTAMAEPWTFAHDVPMLAANARDYLDVGVVETNRAGTRTRWLGVVAWSTIDRAGRGVPEARARLDTVELAWAGRTLALRPAAAGRVDVGIRQAFFQPPQGRFEDAWYPLSAADLEVVARSPPGRVTLRREDGTAVTYLPWRVDARVMARFAEAIGLARQEP